MCGIVGYVGRREALDILIEGLRRQEYRGYDSAGIAVQNGGGLQVVKAPGRIADLEVAVRGHATPLHGACGLGHTRWATHGGVTQRNAHPHLSCDGRIAVVHNGIIENERQLKIELAAHTFTSETDTEVIAHLLEDAVKDGAADPLEAVRRAAARLRGSFAFAAMFESHPGVLVGARLNCPLLIGLGEGESFLASDVAALLPHTRLIVPVEEKELVRISRDGIEIFDAELKVRERAPMTVSWTPEQAARGGYASFMEKEIHEQPATIAAEIADRVAELDGLGLPRDVRRVVVVGCGTAWHAGLAGKVAIEELARLPVELGYASELRYGDYPFDDGCLTVAISQSGETADTLAASRMAREAGSKVLAITNVRGSTLSREADYVLHMR
ncbi:MAG TPA: glutamine--fructose-6-phosphate transaminase (isomerizing), partial [Planctomycetota bacterium]|nr:glutamine--fructose-6-phosphate transaminase (isomerizing) [Planctomycetota bacterium]